MLNKDNINFHPKYVEPFYLRLMNLNFLDDEDNTKIIQQVKHLNNELSHEEILMLLNGNWRPSKVAAWIIGLNKIVTLEKDLIHNLFSRPKHSEHFIISLALMETPSAQNAIEKYMLNRFSVVSSKIGTHQVINNKILDAFEVLESHSIEWGFAIFDYIDHRNNNHLLKNKLLDSNEWRFMIEKISDINQKYNKNFKEEYLTFEKPIKQFKQAMTIIKNLEND